MPDPSLNIPGYRILEVIGSGGMATVYLAEQELLKRKVALKVMSPRLLVDQTFCERFISEAQIVARLSHPHIVTIHEVDVSDDTYYMAMEYIGGGTLQERITERGLSLHDSLMVLKQVAEALGYAHREGFLHRDVKPANILFRDDQTVVLSDFGIAKVLEGDSRLTQTGFALGTPDYMSPEQAMGRELDGRSDLYSLGMVFYEMCTGERAYEHSGTVPTHLGRLDLPIPGLPPECAHYQPIVDRLMAFEPRERYETAQALIDAIADMDRESTAMQDVLPAAMPYSDLHGRHAPRLRRRRPQRIAAILLGGLFLVGLIIGAYALYVATQEPVENAQVSQPLDTESLAKITRLLEVADAHLKRGRLTEPRGSSAYDAYQSVLAIDPHNTEALAGVARVQELAGGKLPAQ